MKSLDATEQDLLDEAGGDRERETREAIRRATVEFLVDGGHLPFGPTRQPGSSTRCSNFFRAVKPRWA